jgi:hypothetical protein
MRSLRRHILEAQWALYARHLAASRLPILIGPWRSEVGFELLYWIPFLHAFRERYQIDPNRLIAIGRGGSAPWYGTAGEADLYEHLPVEVARVLSVKASQQTGSLKQHDTPAWERHVCGLTAESLGITKYHVLSPSWMYQLLRPWWAGEQPVRFLDRYVLQPVRLTAPAIPLELQGKLPATYIAMRWYLRATWPHREDLLLWTRKAVAAVSQHTPVVLIDSGLHMDDHADVHLGTIPNALRLSELYPQTHLNNLTIQSAVIAKAQAYVGTYGGMAQGAMRWGVPTVAFYDTFGQTAPEHLSYSHTLSLKTGVPFLTGKPKHVDHLLSLVTAKNNTSAIASNGV